MRESTGCADSSVEQRKRETVDIGGNSHGVQLTD